MPLGSPMISASASTKPRSQSALAPYSLPASSSAVNTNSNRPTLALTMPRAGANPPLTRLLIGMHDYGSGLDITSFKVTADFKVDDAAPGENLAPKFVSVANSLIL